ncbi:5'/3'-nucleotidase SurE [Hydrogenothermus marinus]|uniref:5'-nucleotidase SurE n=1 Tax=Hydrogenothermus marinus TaxID=133270 RepID=A0A3M0BQ72_9AQUI|nr:5'/3'-nucleotidase SurE [Hydrogenothermus marinus]RMA96978.1 5'-nucleotidase /3'-nucleotidase /exopolyphosphatase [Hydrogenothermus marinus]
MSKYKVLLVNDDGYLSPGINAIRDVLLENNFEVITIAPDRNMSGTSHSLTFTRPLKIEKYKENFYYVIDGTPADCVHLGYYVILKEEKPDILVSGINTGPNLGNDIFYSGTVGAAREGTSFGIPSIALSPASSKNVDFKKIANISLKIINKVLEKSLPKGTFLNINFPVSDIKGFRITKQGRGAYQEKIQKYISPSKETYYWIGGEESLCEICEKDSDYTAVQQGYVSITPIKLDLTDYNSIKTLESKGFIDF